MNYENMKPFDYYGDRERKNEEFVELYMKLIKWLIILAILFAISEACFAKTNEVCQSRNTQAESIEARQGLTAESAKECAPAVSLDRLIDAIAIVESNNNDNAVGDSGKALGRFQIHKAYWKDGTDYLKVDWPYSEATDAKKARRVVKAYFARYGKGKSFAELAAIHNAGPKGYEKMKTNKNIQNYVKKVLAESRLK